jgi:hypothetical protein
MAKSMLQAMLKAVRSAVDENVGKNWKPFDSQTRYRVLNEIFQRAKIIMKVDMGGPSNSTFGSYCTAIRNAILFHVDLDIARKYRRNQLMYAWEWAREHTTAADGNHGERIRMAFDHIRESLADHPDFPQPRKRARVSP